MIKKLNREFFLRRSIPAPVVQHIIQYRPTIRYDMCDWTIKIMIFLLKNYTDEIDLPLENGVQVHIRTRPRHTSLFLSNNDMILHQAIFNTNSPYPHTSALRLIFMILSRYSIDTTFSSFSDHLVRHQTQLKEQIPRMKLYWSRIRSIPKKITPEEQEFMTFIEKKLSIVHDASSTLLDINEYLGLFPPVSKEEADYWLAEANDFM